MVVSYFYLSVSCSNRTIFKKNNCNVVSNLLHTILKTKLVCLRRWLLTDNISLTLAYMYPCVYKCTGYMNAIWQIAFNTKATTLHFKKLCKLNWSWFVIFWGYFFFIYIFMTYLILFKCFSETATRNLRRIK